MSESLTSSTEANFDALSMFRLELEKIEAAFEETEKNELPKLLQSCDLISQQMNSNSFPTYFDSLILRIKILIRLEKFYEAKEEIHRVLTKCKNGHIEKQYTLRLLKIIISYKQGACPSKIVKSFKSLKEEIWPDQEIIPTDILTLECLIYIILSLSLLEISMKNCKQALAYFRLVHKLKKGHELKAPLERKIKKTGQDIKISYSLEKKYFTIEVSNLLLAHSEKKFINESIIRNTSTRKGSVMGVTSGKKIISSIPIDEKTRKEMKRSSMLYLTKNSITEKEEIESKLPEHFKEGHELYKTSIKAVVFLQNGHRKRHAKGIINSIILKSYIAYGKLKIAGKFFFVSFKTDNTELNYYEINNTSILGNLVTLSAYPLENDSYKLKESCYMLTEILEILGSVRIDVLKKQNQVGLLEFVDCNEYGRIVLRKTKRDRISIARLLYRTKKFLDGTDFIIKVFNKGNPDELEIEAHSLSEVIKCKATFKKTDTKNTKETIKNKAKETSYKKINASDLIDSVDIKAGKISLIRDTDYEIFTEV